MSPAGGRSSVPARQRSSLVLLVSVSAVLLAAYFVNMIQWIAAPDIGWLPSVEMGANYVGVVSARGHASGFRLADKVLTINGEPFADRDQIRALVNWSVGGVNRYRVERSGTPIDLEVTTAAMGVRRVALESGPYWLIGIVYLFLGLVVFLMKPWHGPSWAFLVLSVVLSVFFPYSVVLYNHKPFWLYRVLIVAFAIFPAALIHLMSVFPVRRAFTARRLFLVAPYALSTLILAAALGTADRLATVPHPILTTMYLYLLAAIAAFLLSAIHGYFRPPSTAARYQYLVIILGVCLASLMPLFDALAGLFVKKALLPGFLPAPLFIVLFPLSIGYAIIKHDLFEIDTFIRRTYGYVLSTAAIVGAYALLASGFNAVFRTAEILRSPFFTILFTILVVLLFRPLQERIQRLVDRVFYRQRYDYRKTIRSVSEAMTSILDARTIQQTLVGSLTREMFLENGALLVPAAGGSFRAETVEGLPVGDVPPLPAGSALLPHLAAGSPVLRDDLDIHPRYEKERTALGALFAACSSALMFPLRYKEELRGVISLGRKKSGKIFTPEDLDLLQTLANQSAIALENARLFQENLEKGRMEEELKIAHDIQMSMLPERPPQVAGLEIAARSVPAREVGGDFYDFVSAGGGEGRVGMVIGDVSGKAVSGALVMAASRSIFRVLTGTNPGVVSVMNAGNACLLRDVKKGMFVAATYALFDGPGRTMALANAGQPQPLLLRGAAEPDYVATGGDSFPLGIVGAAVYEETRVALEPGDTVVFYSDGVVEAMNTAGELYGFERLVAAVRGGGSATVGEVLARILDDVGAFAAGREPHDDLTVVVVRTV